MSEFKQPPPTRRDLLVAATKIATALLVGRWLGLDKYNGADPLLPNDSLDYKGEVTNAFPATFEDTRAEAVATDLHITPASYLVVGSKTMHAMADGRFKHHDKLVPTVAPGVRKYEKELADTANSSKLPINYLATIATIESAGNAKAVSGADAWGLMQVVPRYHLDGYVKHGYLPDNASYADYLDAQKGNKSAISLAKYHEALQNPKASLQVGADYLRDCVDSARANQPHLDPNSPIIYAWAASAYNGGIGLTRGSYSAMPKESQLYVNHVIRILMDVEIAARLSEQGMDDRAVVKALWSNEMNARAYAYGQLSGVSNYDQRAGLLTKPKPGLHASKSQAIGGDEARQAYLSYLHGSANVPTDNHRYRIPAAPGLRLWLAGGGSSLFNAVPANANWRAK